MGTGTGSGTETRATVEMRMVTRRGTGTRIESRRAKERRRSVCNRTIHVDAMWKPGGDLGGKRGNVAENLENNKKAGGASQGTQDLCKNCISRESVSPLSRLIRGFREKYI